MRTNMFVDEHDVVMAAKANYDVVREYEQKVNQIGRQYVSVDREAFKVLREYVGESSFVTSPVDILEKMTEDLADEINNKGADNGARVDDAQSPHEGTTRE